MREPAKSGKAAQDRYLRFLQRSLSCVSQTAQWYVGPPRRGSAGRSATTNPPAVKLRREAGGPLYLAVDQHFEIVRHPRYPGEWKAKTLRYSYSLVSNEDLSGELILWHWHQPIPTYRDTHIHVRGVGGETHASHVPGVGHKLHIPSGRVAFEAILRFLFTDLGVTPARPDWEEVIGESEDRFLTFRTWG